MHLNSLHECTFLSHHSWHKHIREKCNVYVGNLEREIDDEMLRRHFSKFGTITSPKVMRDKQGVSKGYGFVCFTTPGEASLAVRMMMKKPIIRNELYVALQRTKEEKMALKKKQQLPNLALLDVSVVIVGTISKSLSVC